MKRSSPASFEKKKLPVNNESISTLGTFNCMFKTLNHDLNTLSFVEFSGRQHFHKQRDVCSDFFNLIDSPVRSSKMLKGVVFAYLLLVLNRGKCVCVVSV